MSTHSKDLKAKQSSETIIKTNKRSVDASLRNLQKEMEQENMLVQETPVGRVQRVLKVYRGIKPLLSVLSTLPLIPATWRTYIVLFDQSLDDLSDVGGEIAAQFKAGKDLAEQE